MIDAAALDHPFVFCWYIRATGQILDSRKYYVGVKSTSGECGRCAEYDEVHDEHCPEHPDYDPSRWCDACGARTADKCTCLPIADND